jgi:hypothetical protein
VGALVPDVERDHEVGVGEVYLFAL